MILYSLLAMPALAAEGLVRDSIEGTATDFRATRLQSPPPAIPERGEMELLPPTGAPTGSMALASPDESPFDCPPVGRQGRLPLEPYWDHGLWFVSPDENFQLHAGGNLQWDSIWLIGPRGVLESGNNSSSTGNAAASLLRRARLKFEGHIYQSVDYSLEFDLANAVNDNKGLQNPTQDNVADSPFPANVWVQLREVGWLGRVRVGNQVKPLGMTNNTYQGFLPFIERADNMDGFYGPFDEGFNPGISASNWTQSERIAWRYGIYRPLKNAFGFGLDEYSVIGRLTALPAYRDDGRRLLHIGISGSQGSLVDNDLRVRARPVLRNGPGYAVPILVDTGSLPASNQYLIGPELAGVWGSWTFQAEWAAQFFDQVEVAGNPSQDSAFVQGGYAQLLYFLTGEHQEYDRREGVFGRVVPLRPLGLGGAAVRGYGAWQVGARYSYLNLTDRAIEGGRVDDLTLGLNWFLNPNVKIQGNYILEHREAASGDGWFSGLGIRAACDF